MRGAGDGVRGTGPEGTGSGFPPHAGAGRAVWLSDLESLGGARYRVEALRCGEWSYPSLPEGLRVTPAMLAEFKANFEAGVKGFEVPVNREHDDERPCGWVRGLELSDDGRRLFALLDVTDPGVDGQVGDGTLRYASSELDLSWTDPESGRTMPVFEGLALTNRPYIKRMAPIAPINLSEFAARGAADGTGGEGSQEVRMSETNGAARLAEMEAKLIAAESEAEQTRTRLAEMERRVAETQARLASEAVKGRLQRLVRGGRLTAPAYAKALALCEALAAGGARTVRLTTKFRLSEVPGGVSTQILPEVSSDVPGDDEADQIDVAEAILQVLEQLPDAMAVDPDPEGAPPVEGENPAGADGDEDDRLLREADAQMARRPGLQFREALQIARTKVRGGK